MSLGLAICFLLAQDTSAPPPPGKLIGEMDNAAQRVIEEASRSVVLIQVEREPDAKTPSGPARGPASGPFSVRPQDAPCSGFVLDADGFILTSYFNMEGKVKKVQVTLPTGAVHDAEILGFDAPLDVALLKIAAKNLPTLKYADLKKLSVGQMVFVLGRNPEGGEISLAQGILSAFERFAGRMVQMDCRTNFSNSGGPLLDAQGRLVGITCKIHTRYASTYGQNSGVSFAATWDKIAEALPRLKEGSRVREDKRPFLGISFDPATEEDGVTVSQVHPNTAADKAGFKAGDLLVEFDGARVKNSTDLLREINKHKPGDKIPVKIKREGTEMRLEIILGERVVDE